MTGSMLQASVARGLLVLLTALVAVSCDAAGFADQGMSAVARGFTPGTVHPTNESMPERGQLAAHIRIAAPLETTGALQRTVARLRGARALWSIGALEGDESQVFGNVEDVAVDEVGRLFILDSRYNKVRVHDRTGRPVGSFAGPGRGPGELMAPEALERDRSGRVVVADRYNTIKIFEPVDSTFFSAGSIAVRFVPEDFCLLGDRIYVQGVRRDGGVVHAFSSAGDSLISFGSGYPSHNWLVRNQLSDGPIACNEETQTVVVMYKYLPVIYGYSPDGRKKWVSQLADFTPIGITEGVEPNGLPSVSFTPRPEGHDLATSLLTTGDFIVVQTARHTLGSVREKREYAELRTYLLSAATGKGVYVGNRLPRLKAVTNDHAYAVVNDPYPHVQAYGLDRTEAQ